MPAPAPLFPHLIQPVSAVFAGHPDTNLTFKVTKQGVELMEPRLPRLAAIRGRAFAASVLLFELMQRGVYLVPHGRDAEAAGLAMKVLTLHLLSHEGADAAPA